MRNQNKKKTDTGNKSDESNTSINRSSSNSEQTKTNETEDNFSIESESILLEKTKNEDLERLYKILIAENSDDFHFEGWKKDYLEFTNAIQQIKKKIEKPEDLSENRTYNETIFEHSTTPFKDFIKKLLYEKYNGIAGKGRSTLSKENLENMLSDSIKFNKIIYEIIKDPSPDSNDEFTKYWESKTSQNNPVLINRAMAACTTNVSCLVDERKFDQVFNWLQDQKMIDEYTSTKLDWFSKNKYLIEQLKSKLSVGNEDEHNISLFVWQVYDKIINTFNLKKQVVKYGPPGTGKTYLAKKKNKLLFNIWKNEFANCSTFDIDDHNTIVQFHPSFTYEDFIEGLKPVQVGKSTTALKLTNGIFKSFCKKAARWEIDIQNLKDKGVHIPYDWDDIDVAFVKRIESQIKEKEHEHWEFVFTLDAKYDNLKLTDVVPPYFFIIDEINRAEISRVFGELMFCLEYRGYKDGSIKTQYSQLNDNETGMIKKNDQYYFFIPHNVYIIGTMNNIDRSVDTFDFALRRRFRWEEMIPDIEVLKFHLGKINNEWVELANNLDALNDAIIQENELLGSDYQIGHAYLWDLDKYYSDKQKVSSIRKMVWENNIEPILKEYIRGTGKEKDLIPKFAAKFGIK